MNHYSTMTQGYYYCEAKNIGYTVTVGKLYFSNVAYHSKSQLIDQLVKDGYSRDDIKTTKEV